MSAGASRRSLYFVAPGQVEIRTEPCPVPGQDEVLVQTVVSAISPGTEMLFYRGQVPAGMSVDSTLEGLTGPVSYPLKYGYACVGRVTRVGSAVDAGWQGRMVFAFHPHESHFCVRPDDLFPVSAEMHIERAALLPNAETATNFVMDGAPLLGEQVVLFGQGIVGLLVTRLLASFPLQNLAAVDFVQRRLDLANRLGAMRTFTPDDVTDGRLRACLAGGEADLIFELSGNPEALDQAIQHAGFGGRIVIGSWYGTKQATLDLGGHFHRNRIQLISSQVSTIAPHLRGRWTKSRRLELACTTLADLPIDQLISHRFAIEDAPAAYNLLDTAPEETVQILLTYL